jgi:hypothetical protein
MNGCLKAGIAALLAQVVGVATVLAEGLPSASQAQQALAVAAAGQRYTFLVFYKENSAATRAMAQTVKNGVESRGDRATWTYVNVGDPAEKALVDRFGVGRAPMPLTIAVAPNGAMTKLTPTSITDEQIEKSFVTPAMAHCMKSMQDGRLVLGRAEVHLPRPGQLPDDPARPGRGCVVGGVLRGAAGIPGPRPYARAAGGRGRACAGDGRDRAGRARTHANHPLVARRARRIITVSHSARADIISVLGVPASRIDVVYGAASPALPIRARPFAKDSSREKKSPWSPPGAVTPG